MEKNLILGADGRVVEQWGSRPHPKEWPTLEQFLRARERIHDPNGRFFHFGISGVVKAGKSSLINSLRGVKALQRFDYPGNRYPFIMYDIPGSGTFNVPADTYFNEQGLFAMDAIIVLVKDSFQDHDADLISHCQRLNIPTYVVKSHTDTAIRNMCEDDEDEIDDPDALLRAKEKYKIEGKANILRNLQLFGLHDEKVYLVNSRSMLRLVNQSWVQLSSDKFAVDEAELLKDLLDECRRRRLPVPEDQGR
ncbi:hypothetical protein DL96DRAFT_1466341 [Flagelloscypha sp. PMI_526]|nr:hypothetical protein DL96DRAFT_1466341 [Flagelloscypha sp. PMI_526]